MGATEAAELARKKAEGGSFPALGFLSALCVSVVNLPGACRNLCERAGKNSDKLCVAQSLELLVIKLFCGPIFLLLLCLDLC